MMAQKMIRKKAGYTGAKRVDSMVGQIALNIICSACYTAYCWAVQMAHCLAGFLDWMTVEMMVGMI